MACVSTLVQAGFPVASRGAKINTTTRTTNGASAGRASSTFVPGGSLRLELDENPEAIISGEWPENFSLLSYDDLRAYLQSQQQPVVVVQAGGGGGGVNQKATTLLCQLCEAMSTPVLVATADQTLEEVERHFEAVSGLPAVDGSSLSCVVVVVKNDRTKASHGPKSKVAEIMTAPAITLSSDTTVMDAAALMLKKKIHRLPVVNQDRQVIGMVTSADVLRELEGLRLRV